MMCIICKNRTHSRCFYLTYDNFAMCLPCNHNSFPISEISNIQLFDLFLSTTKITTTTFNEICFPLAEPRTYNDYLTPSEINSANGMSLKKHSYFYFKVHSLARPQRRSQNEAEEAMPPLQKNLRCFAGVLHQSQLFENKRKEQSDSCSVVFSH